MLTAIEETQSDEIGLPSRRDYHNNNECKRKENSCMAVAKVNNAGEKRLRLPRERATPAFLPPMLEGR